MSWKSASGSEQSSSCFSSLELSLLLLVITLNLLHFLAILTLEEEEEIKLNLWLKLINLLRMGMKTGNDSRSVFMNENE